MKLNISLSRGKVSVAVLVALQGAETPKCLKLVQGNAEVMEALLSAWIVYHKIIKIRINISILFT